MIENFSPALAGRARSAPRRMAPPRVDRLLVTLLLITVVGVFAQITLGGVVRVTGSGLGCPDWPLCHGQIIPPFDYHTLLEWSHRTVGALVGLTLLAATIRAWISHRPDRLLVWAATAAMILITVVGGIGGGVVLTELDPALRTAHLALAQIVLLLVILATVAAALYQPERRALGGVADPTPAHPRWRYGMWASVAAGLSGFIALLSGSYLVWVGASAVCPQWPLCGGPIIPQHALTWIHMIHRALALVSVVIVMGAAHLAFRLPGATTGLRWTAIAALTLVVLQVLSGAANPWTGFDTWARAAHLSLATLLWVALILMALLMWRPTGNEEAEQHEGVLEPVADAGAEGAWR